ncbi:MAG TPA: hypothetical protein VFN55_19305 [Solirubrobacteraceae bacterium]|nr:hypothetical protein [Solirubrobacteraceae bacterium]
MTGRLRPAVLRILHVSGAALAAASLAPTAAQAGWSRPFDLSPPGTMDRLAAQLAVAPSGAAAAAFSVTDLDTPGSAQAELVTRSAAGAVSAPRPLTGVREVLDLGFTRRGLELLTGSSPAGLDCCSSVSAGRWNGIGLAGAQTLVGGLTGASTARLVTLTAGRQLAAIASERGVWAAMSGSNGRFARPRRLTGNGQVPQAMSAAALDGQNAIVAWTAATGPAGYADPRAIFYGLASRHGVPRHAGTLLRTPSGHRIEELAAARRATRATVAWTESWYDRRGSLHSEVRAADVAAHPGVHDFPAVGGLASGVSLAADAAGAQVLVYKACRADGGCTVRVALRGRTTPFGAVRSLGAIDDDQTPSVSVSSGGRIVVVFARAGHPMAAVGSASGGAIGVARSLSPTTFAYDVTVADGGRRALAAWSQGTLNPSIAGAVLP